MQCSEISLFGWLPEICADEKGKDVKVNTYQTAKFFQTTKLHYL